MAKSKKAISKNIKKVNDAKKENKKNKNQLLTLGKIIIGLIIISALAIILCYAVSDEYNFGKKEKTDIVYDEIIAGQTFDKKDELYYVAIYNHETDAELTETIEQKTSTIYRVDLNKKINQTILNETTNLNTSNAEELKVTQATLIKIEKNKNVEVIEGKEEIEKYLEAIN